MSGEVSEHDYATYIIEQAMESGDNHVVIAVNEFDQGEFLHFQAVQSENGVNSVEAAQTENLNGNVPVETVMERIPPYRGEAAPQSTSGYWSEADVHRLLRIYLKHIRAYPNLKGRPVNFIWEKIASDFDKKKRYTKHQIKSKMLRLKNTGKTFLQYGDGGGKQWPFLKAVEEILKLEDSFGKSSEKRSQNWRREEIVEMLSLYKTNLVENPDTKRRHLLTRVARELNRPRFDVQMKLQSLRASYKRCKDGVMHHSWPYLQAMKEVLSAEETHEQALLYGQSSYTAPKNEESGYRSRWGKDATLLLINTYKQKLEELKSKNFMTTKVQVYRSVAETLKVAPDSVQVKISSLKTHWNKSGKMASNKWQFQSQMRDVVRLESAIWLEEEYGSETEADPEETKVVKAPQREVAEPAWVKHYRQDVKRRHVESMKIRGRILQALEKLVNSNRSGVTFRDMETLLD